MMFEKVAADGPSVLAAYIVRDDDGTELGRVERRRTCVDDWRRGLCYGQKPAVRWFSAKPGQIMALRIGSSGKYRTRDEAAAALRNDR